MSRSWKGPGAGYVHFGPDSSRAASFWSSFSSLDLGQHLGLRGSTPELPPV